MIYKFQIYYNLSWDHESTNKMLLVTFVSDLDFSILWKFGWNLCGASTRMWFILRYLEWHFRNMNFVYELVLKDRFLPQPVTWFTWSCGDCNGRRQSSSSLVHKAQSALANSPHHFARQLVTQPPGWLCVSLVHWGQHLNWWGRRLMQLPCLLRLSACCSFSFCLQIDST